MSHLLLVRAKGQLRIYDLSSFCREFSATTKGEEAEQKIRQQTAKE
jgi:hypothetical protein